MALVAREVKVVAAENHVVGVEKKVVVNKELGVAAEVENVAVTVDLGDGKVGVVTQHKIVGVQAQVPNNRVLVYQPKIHVVHSVPQTCSRKAKNVYYAYGAIMFAYTLMLVLSSLLMFWALPCSFVALILACYAESDHKSGNYKRAKRFKVCSFCWSFAAISSAILIPLMVALGTVYGLKSD